ncbi:MAG: nicotinate (nicotinamide) nucleotide adenylyltransferase [Candidatus Izemoplasmataceae bacterium]
MHVVYGGAFNPPTKAHLDVFYFLDHEIRVDAFTYLPVGKAYGKDDLEADHDRLTMLRRMTGHLERVEVSTLEMDDETYKGTYASLKRLQRDHEPMAFVIGADHLSTLHEWKQADKLLSAFSCLVLNREATSLDAIIENDAFLKRHKDNLHIFHNFKVDISSSDFRRTKDPSLLVPSVYEYIKAHGLYGIHEKG